MAAASVVHVPEGGRSSVARWSKPSGTRNSSSSTRPARLSTSPTRLAKTHSATQLQQVGGGEPGGERALDDRVVHGSTIERQRRGRTRRRRPGRVAPARSPGAWPRCRRRRRRVGRAPWSGTRRRRRCRPRRRRRRRRSRGGSGSNDSSPTARRSPSNAASRVGLAAMVAARFGTKPRSAAIPSRIGCDSGRRGVDGEDRKVHRQLLSSGCRGRPSFRPAGCRRFPRREGPRIPAAIGSTACAEPAAAPDAEVTVRGPAAVLAARPRR